MLKVMVLVRIDPCSETPCDHRCYQNSLSNCFTPFHVHSYLKVPLPHEFSQKSLCLQRHTTPLEECCASSLILIHIE